MGNVKSAGFPLLSIDSLKQYNITLSSVFLRLPPSSLVSLIGALQRPSPRIMLPLATMFDDLFCERIINMMSPTRTECAHP